MNNLELEIYNINKYKKFIDETTCFTDSTRKNYYGKSQYQELFYEKLLDLSNNRCYYCGEKLYSNNKEGLYKEREHIIDKKIFNEEDINEKLIYKQIENCKKNLIPVCKNCNSIKSFRNKNDIKKEINKKQECRVTNCKSNCLDVVELSKSYNYDFLEVLKFDFLNLQYYSEAPEFSRILNLELNFRINNMFEGLFEFIYDVNIDVPLEKKKNIYSYLTNNIVEEKMIEIIENYNLINSKKLKNLIKTITLLNLK